MSNKLCRNKRSSTGWQIAMAVLITLFCSIGLQAQTKAGATITQNQLSDLLSNQPDHIADQEIKFFPKLTFTIKYAQKQNAASQEYLLANKYKLIAIVQLSQKKFIILDPQKKIYYEELSEDFQYFGEMAQVLPFPIIRLDQFVKGKEMLLPNEDSSIEVVGKELIDGKTSLKVKASDKSGTSYYFWFAGQLKNLLVNMELNSNEFSYSSRLSNIVMNVPASLFQVPAGYKKVEFEELLSAIPPELLLKEMENMRSGSGAQQDIGK
jgi:hypothetical protein